jgi:hypothetical protein
MAEPGMEGYACWRHPLRAAQIHMDPEAVRSLSSQALHSLKADCPAEIGGLLWGKHSHNATSDSGDSTVIVYAQFIPSKTSLYNTSQADASSLIGAIKASGAETSLSLVGYFRSHIREGLYLSRDDQDLIQHYMRDPRSVFLVVRPFEMGICMGGFFFWDKDRLQTDASELEVALIRGIETDGSEAETSSDAGLRHPRTPNPVESDPVQIRLGDAEDRGSLAASNSVGEPAPMQAGNSQISVPVRRRRGVFSRLVLGVSLAALTLATAYWTMPGLRSKLEGLGSYTPSGQLGLQVVRTGEGQLNVSWNRSAPHLGAAHRAKLTITDGPFQREVDMDSAQLRSGKVTYFPSGKDVQLRLEVYMDESHSMAESVRVLLPGTQASTVEPAGAPDSVKNGLTPVASGETVRQEAVHPRHDEAVQPAIRPKARPFVPPQRVAGFREIHPSRRVAASLPVPDLRFEAGTQDSAALNLPLTHLPIPSAWSAGAPRVAKRPNTIVFPSSQAPVLSSAPRYTPPRPIKRVIPDTSPLRITPLYQLTQIEIQVRIDSAGQVVGACPVSEKKKGPALLTDSALAAARKWTFEPATMNGKAIPVDYSIVFAFHPARQ